MGRFFALRALGRDVRSAYRSLRAAPGFTAAVLVVMTLSMGATTAVFSVVDAVTLRGLPFDEADRLVSLDRTVSGRVVTSSYAAPDFLMLRARQDVFEGLAAVADGSLVLRRDGAVEPEILRTERVSAEFFPVLRVAPSRGRLFTVDNEATGHDRVAVISHGLWQRRFGGASDILGKRLPAEQGEIEIIGVMPAGFAYPVGATQPTELWVPYVVPDAERVARVSAYLTLIARLKDNVTMGRAQARIDQIAAASVVGGAAPGPGQVPTLRDLHESLTGYARTWMLMLLAAVACMLLIACANIANLLLVRATVRTRELAVRSALGATRWQLARLLLVESLLLSVAGTALGVVVASGGIEILRSLLPPFLPGLADIAIDARVLTMSVAAALVTGLGFGLAPLFSRSHSAMGVLTESGRASTASTRAQWLRTTFLVSEVALTVVLLVGTALFLTSFARLMRVDVGVDYRDVLTVDVRPKSAGSTSGPGLEQVLARVSAIPGIETVAAGSGNVPFSLSVTSAPLSLPGRNLPAGAPRSIGVSGVSTDYFRVLRVPLRRGRYFTAAEGVSNAAVVILNEMAATTLFPGEDPIGQRVGAGFGDPRIVIGIVGDVRGFGPEGGIDLQAFTPLTRTTRGTLLARLTGSRAAIEPQVKAAIWSEFPDLAIPSPRMLEDGFGVLIAARRFSMILLSMFGVLGIAIAGVGIHGVMSYIVAQRTREIGIRMALGALPSEILLSVLRRASTHVAAGLAVGLGMAWLAATSVEKFLFRVGSHDLRLYGAVAGVLVIVAFAAALIPARWAARVDPLVALRLE